MREKLETLPLTQLRELARGQGIKNVSGLRKSELVDRLCEVAERENAAEAENAAGTEKAEKTEKTEPTGRQARAEKGERKERAERSEQTDRQERGNVRLRMVLCLRQATPEMICRTWTAGLKPMEFWRLCQTDLDSYGVRIFFREKMMSTWPRLRFDGSI